MRIHVFSVSIASLAILVSGCASTKIGVAVNSYSDGVALKPTAYIFLADQSVSTNTLEFQEYSRHLERTMASKGWRRVANAEDAEVAVFVSYGIGDPKNHDYSYAMPTFGQTGVASSSTTGTIRSYGSTSTYTANTTYSPTYGVTGYVPVSGSYTTYNRWLNLNAVSLIEYKSTKRMRELWRLNVVSEGSSGDLRKIFPYLAYASIPYIGVNSGKAISVDFPEDGKAIRAFLESPAPVGVAK